MTASLAKFSQICGSMALVVHGITYFADRRLKQLQQQTVKVEAVREQMIIVQPSRDLASTSIVSITGSSSNSLRFL